ncbi:MAG: hypothetical protein R3190_12805 [Thermoanaerobaculia bacterium]|nr:hypothetical protein [Thermoanaerobaculia bacterium]
MPEDLELEAAGTEESDNADRSLELKDLGWLLLGGGALAALVNLGRNRSLVGWILPVALGAAGVAILTETRRAGIDEARARILAELDGLDPIARAQVLASVGRATLPLLKPTEAE